MKIILLNPQIDAQHKIVKTLQEKGVAVLFPADHDELWKMLQLHGQSVDLVITHSSGHHPDDPSLKIIEKIKKDPNNGDLAILLTTVNWSETECAAHQEGPTGVNAYLKSPWTDSQFIETIEGIVGSLGGASSAQAAQVSPPVAPPSGNEPLVFETKAFTRVGLGEISIQFDAPDAISADSNASLSIEGSASGVDVSAPVPGSDAPLELDLNVSQIGVPAESPPVSTPDDLSQSQPPVNPDATQMVSPESLSGPLELQLGEAGPNPSDSPANADQIAGSDFAPILSADPSHGHMSEADLSNLSMEAIEHHSDHEHESPRKNPTPTSPKAPAVLSEEEQFAKELPYLFKSSPNLLFSEPIGDAVVPGGAVYSPDLDTIKKYLLLREQDVAILSNQLKIAQEEITKAKEVISSERTRNTESTHLLSEQKKKIDQFEADKSQLVSNYLAAQNELQFQIKAKSDHLRVLERQVKELDDQMERLKERVRVDIRKIRVREKELENQLEIAKKDADVLLSTRENKIIELKRKIDLLEFNMDLVQEQFAREKENSVKLRERLDRAAQAHRVAMGLLDTDHGAKGLESSIKK